MRGGALFKGKEGRGDFRRFLSLTVRKKLLLASNASQKELLELIKAVSGSPASSIQTRTLFGSSPRQVPMAHNLRFRKENLQIPEKISKSPLARMAVPI